MKKLKIGKEVATIERREGYMFTFTDVEIVTALANYCKLGNPGIAEVDAMHSDFNYNSKEFIYVTKRIEEDIKDSNGESLTKAPTSEQN